MKDGHSFLGTAGKTARRLEDRLCERTRGTETELGPVQRDPDWAEESEHGVRDYGQLLECFELRFITLKAMRF